MQQIVPMTPNDEVATLPLLESANSSSASSTSVTVPRTPPNTTTGIIDLVTPSTGTRTASTVPNTTTVSLVTPEPNDRSDNPCVNWICVINYNGTKSDGSPQLSYDVAKHYAAEIGKNSRFAVFGREVAPTTGQQHLQGFAILAHKQRFTSLQKKYHKEIHWERMTQDWETNYDYCTKTDKDPLIFGVRPAHRDNGAREADRWKKARVAAQAGTFEDVDDQIYISCFKSLIAIRAHAVNTTEWLTAPCGMWYYGPPGTGKSHNARLSFREGGVYVKAPNKWWCHYNGEETVIIEDLDLSHSYMLNYLKIWTDIYPFPCEVKGTAIKNIRPKRIIVTSNHAIESIFPLSSGISLEDQKALMRRFKRTYFGIKYSVQAAEHPDADADVPSIGVMDLSDESRFITPIPLTRSVTICPTPATTQLDEE